MRALPILLVFIAILLTREPSHIRPVKTGNANDPVQTCSFSFELPRTAEFRGTNFVWIVPSSGALMYTRDGGGSWSEIGADTIGGFLMLSFADENNGWAINWSGQLWKTETGGQNWNKFEGDSSQGAPPFAAAVDFKLVDKLHGWMLGPFQIWRTADGGHTWQSYAPTNYYYHFFSFFPLDPYEVWVGGLGGVVYHIEEGGERWEEVQPGPERNEASEEIEFRDVFFISKDVGWANGLEGELFRTLDGGKNWRPLSFSIPGEGWAINSIYFLNRNDGWAVGWGPDNNVYENKGAIVLQTADGGLSWKEVDIKHDESSYELVSFSDSQNGWMLSRRNVYRTVDGGKTWSNVLQLPQSRTEK
jgi:photosystem II stability/assembly factor-like uncharacterized protein